MLNDISKTYKVEEVVDNDVEAKKHLLKDLHVIEKREQKKELRRQQIVKNKNTALLDKKEHGVDENPDESGNSILQDDDIRSHESYASEDDLSGSTSLLETTQSLQDSEDDSATESDEGNAYIAADAKAEQNFENLFD